MEKGCRMKEKEKLEMTSRALAQETVWKKKPFDYINIFERGASLSLSKSYDKHDHLLKLYSYPGSYKTASV